jgi:hypothetical protein
MHNRLLKDQPQISLIFTEKIHVDFVKSVANNLYLRALYTWVVNRLSGFLHCLLEIKQGLDRSRVNAVGDRQVICHVITE